MSDSRRRCSLAARTKVLLPSHVAQAATILELGPETLVLRTLTTMPISSLVAVDFELPGHAKEINAIAKVVRPDDAEEDAVCELIHLPMIERELIRRWAATDPTPRPAARLRVG